MVLHASAIAAGVAAAAGLHSDGAGVDIACRDLLRQRPQCCGSRVLLQVGVDAL